MKIYEVLESVLIFSEMADTAQLTYDKGKEQYKKYEKQKKIKILELVFGIIGMGALAFGPIGIAVSAVADLAIFVGVSITNGTIDPTNMALSLLGIVVPVFSEVA